MTKITVDDDALSVLTKMSSGNPGACSVIAMLLQDNEMAILDLDTKGIYGSDIWVLWKDISKMSLDTFRAALCMPDIKQQIDKIQGR